MFDRIKILDKLLRLTVTDSLLIRRLEINCSTLKPSPILRVVCLDDKDTPNATNQHFEICFWFSILNNCVFRISEISV